MEIVKTVSLSNKYPHLGFQLQSDKILSICNCDHNRCLKPSEAAEDYSLIDGNNIITITRVFTAFARECSGCPRNTI